MIGRSKKSEELPVRKVKNGKSDPKSVLLKKGDFWPKNVKTFFPRPVKIFLRIG